MGLSVAMSEKSAYTARSFAGSGSADMGGCGGTSCLATAVG